MTHSIYGEKGGKSGGGSARVAKEAPNTLQSNSVARILDAIGEGEIVGLVDGHKSIIIDETPLQNEDGSYNFDGVVVTTRTGLPDQDFIPGFPSVETIRDISTQVYQATPVVRTISTLTANAARVTISLPRLTEQNKKNGDLNGSSVTIAFDVMPAGGSWSEVIYNTISGKTTSTYQRSYRFELPGTGPWDIRMRRISDDESDDEAIQNDTYWATLTELTDAKLSYPDTALVALEVNAKDFGDTIPSRSYDVKGKIINVPDNYDPETREYTGLWSGNFKLAWSDNPAWVYYDLATNERYGAAIDNVDKWSLYQIAQYCDELVDNGYGEQEPRYTFNSVLSSEEEAFDALNSLASVFRGMTFWGSDTVVATADMPADPMKLVTPSNVIDGEFEYQGTSLKDRHSIVLVTWNDPDSNYEKTIEVVEDSAAIQKYGFRKADLTAVGCTSRGQARRLGLWTLYSERSETETVTYRASVDHANLRPGEIIQVSDPSIAGARLGGRVRTPGLSTLTLDRRPEEASGSDWYLDVVMPNGGIERREVVDFNDNDVTLSSPLNNEPVMGAQWILSSSDVEPRTFRVIGIAEEDEGIYSITAVEHNPNKYAEIEQGLVLPEPDYSLLPSGPVSAPYNISTDTSTYIAGGTQHQKLTISWTGSDDPRVTSYICEVDGPDDVAWVGVYSGEGLSVDLNDISPGEWQIRVRGVTSLGQTSPWVIITTTIVGLLEPVAPDAVGVEVGTFQVKLSPTGGKPGQLWQYWRSNVALADDSLIETNAVLLASSNGFYTDTGLDPLTTYYYYIRGANNYGVSGWYPVQATTEGDASAILAALTDKITEGQLYQALNDRLDKIETNEAAIETEATTRQTEDESLATQITTVQSQLGDDLVLLEQSLGTEIDAIDGTVSALYTLRTDVNGRVSGFGLSNDGVESEFGILADRLYIADPDNAGNEDIAFVFDNGTLYLREALIGSLTFNKLTDDSGTFIVQNGKLQAQYIDATGLTVEWANIQNVEVQTAQIANAAITSAKIDDLAVTSAKIGNAAVDTLKIAGNAITVPVGSFTSGSANINSSGWTTVQSLSINPEGGACILSAGFAARIALIGNQYSLYAYNARIMDGSTQVAYFPNVFQYRTPNTANASDREFDETGYVDLSFLDDRSSFGTRTYSLQVSWDFDAYNDHDATTATRRHLSAVGAKR